MKRLVLILVIALVGFTTNAQNIDLDPKIDFDMKDLDVKVDVKVKEIFSYDFVTKLETKVREKVESKVKVNLNPNLDIKVKTNFGEDMSDYQQTEQSMEIPLSKPGERGKLLVESHNGRITITGYGGNSVKVKMVKYGKKVDRDKTKDGMKLVSSGGFNVEAEEYNNTVQVEKEGWGDRVDFVIQVPKNFDIEAETYNNGHIWIEDIEGEVNVETYNGPVTLSKISGAASASTYNGAIEVDFNSVTADSPMVFTTYNGNVDLTVPGGTKISTKMKTNRDIYTDFDNFSLNEAKPETRQGRNGRGYSVKYENWIEGDLNGGGASVTMKTTNGNIYIRKGS